MRTIWIGIAGFLGAAARYHLDGLVGRRGPGAFPWGTLAVNLTGCFVLGVVATLLTERFVPNQSLRLALTVGFLGSYTTFSTFAFETVRLAEDGAGGIAVLNVAASVVLGVVAAVAGIALARAA